MWLQLKGFFQLSPSYQLLLKYEINYGFRNENIRNIAKKTILNDNINIIF